ncbi:SWI/SNF-related matrix-associated actin-dependent regulator of chromatin subfamily A-like protein [Arachis hypogaea]|nr:SWI/SNF-related matrix-associated actin-dependent regulator of chromatin subfamily A-like protein [Arachis hypogaea]
MLEVVKAKIKSAKSKDESESLKFTQKNLINKVYTNSADAKIPAALEYLGTFIEAGCKFLIFAHHQPMIDAIHECLLKKKVGCIWIDGGTLAASRQQLVTDFQEKDYIKAAVLSIKAGGVGLTLTAASTVIFAEQSWTPSDLIRPMIVLIELARDVVQFKPDNLGQMLDAHENTLAVSNNQPLSNPAKHTTIGHSPSKQRTLDQFVRRCDNVVRSEVRTSA